MKKTAFLILVISILSACQPAQASETSEVFSTPTPIPTPTLHPDFIALQESIAASGGRFTLRADGLLYDGETPIPGVSVAPDGVMTITVNGEEIALDPADVDFDDEKGITIKGYELDEKTGAWVEATETVTIGGVKMTVGEDGVVTEMEATGADADTKADNLAKVDPTKWGFEAGEADIVKDETGIHMVVDGNNVAKWVGTEWEWDWQVLEGLEGGNPLFELAKTWEMKGVNVVDRVGAETDSALLDAFAQTEGGKTGKHPMVDSVFVFSDDGKEAIGGFLIAGNNVRTSEDAARVDRTQGIFCFIADSGEMVAVSVKNFDSEIRYWR